MKTNSIQEAWPEAGSYCWGCGKNNEHGLQLQSYWEDDEVVATWTPKEHHLAFPGVLNGGIIATLIDCHGTGTANAAAHRDAEGSDNHFMHVTAGISVKFLKPTPIDKPVTLRAKITERTEHKMTVSCTLYSGDMKCVTGDVFTVRVDQALFLD